MGFIKARSCPTALDDVVGDLGLKLDENSIAFLVLLDHIKAFDTVEHKILLKLHTLFYFFNSTCSLIRSYLMIYRYIHDIYRSQRVYLNGNISNSLNIGRDIPQISTLAFFCAVYSLTTYLMSSIIIPHTCTLKKFLLF